MNRSSSSRPRIPAILPAFAVTCGLAILAGCGSTPVSLDNPLDGQSVALAVSQPLRVKLSNVSGGGAWVREGDTPDSVEVLDPAVRDAANGVKQLQTFEFVGAAPGEDVLTFVYRRPGVEPDVSDVIRIAVKVS